MFQCLTAAFFAVLCLTLLHTSTNVVDKLAAQNSADAAARGAAVWLARGLNVISSANHVAGEIVGMIAVQEAIKQTVLRANETLDAELDKLAADQAQLGPITEENRPLAEELADRQEKIESERRILADVALRASALDDACNRLRAVVLPKLQAAADAANSNAPIQARRVADLAARHARGTVAFMRARLPVQRDEAETWLNSNQAAEEQCVNASQLTRASYPWALFHGRPIWLGLTEHAPLSRAAEEFSEQLLYATRCVSWQVQASGQFNPYILLGATSPDKGHELWTDSPTQVDRHFGVLCVVAYGDTRLPHLSGERVFARDGERYVFAQALVYNANPQQAKAVGFERVDDFGADRQPAIGWDTLQWDTGNAPPPADVMADLPGGTPADDHPLIRPNWQAKLVPASAELLSALVQQDPRLADAIGLPPIVEPLFLTH